MRDLRMVGVPMDVPGFVGHRCLGGYFSFLGQVVYLSLL